MPAKAIFKNSPEPAHKIFVHKQGHSPKEKNLQILITSFFSKHFSLKDHIDKTDILL